LYIYSISRSQITLLSVCYLYHSISTITLWIRFFLTFKRTLSIMSIIFSIIAFFSCSHYSISTSSFTSISKLYRTCQTILSLIYLSISTFWIFYIKICTCYRTRFLSLIFTIFFSCIAFLCSFFYSISAVLLQ
jgi:hypothetical protein